MKYLLFAATLTAIALSASAQQGPAGVPGAPGLAPMPPLVQTAPAAPTAKRAPKDCGKAKDVDQCKARQAARKAARQACRGKAQAEFKACVRDQLKPR